MSYSIMLCRPVVRSSQGILRRTPRQIPHRRHASFIPSLVTLPSLPSLTSLSELLLTHPFPTYTGTIVLLTLGVRTVFTLPATIWARRRMQRMREIVRPEMQRINERLAVEVARDSKRKGLGYDEYKKELKRQVSTIRLCRYFTC
jgi:membrane protein insertase Oxa1/YidC/SpoIIIJ